MTSRTYAIIALVAMAVFLAAFVFACLPPHRSASSPATRPEPSLHWVNPDLYIDP